MDWGREAKKIADRSKAFQEGFSAYRWNQHQGSNPHTGLDETINRQEWDDGWFYAHTWREKERNR